MGSARITPSSGCVWFDIGLPCQEVRPCVICASAIEAATAGETPQSGSTEGESAVAESQTPNNSGTTP